MGNISAQRSGRVAVGANKALSNLAGVAIKTALNFAPGSDVDMDLITVGVSGAPKLWWNEATDSFEMNKSLTLTGGSLTVDAIISPDTNKDLTITDTNLEYHDGTRTRLSITASEGNLKSPDGDNRFRTNNTNAAIIVGGSLRLVVGSGTSYLRSSDQDRGVWVKQASVALRENNKDRVWVDNLNSTIYSPNLANYLNVTSSAVNIVQGGNNRLKVDANYTQMLSPDGGNLNIGNSGVFYSGAAVQMSTHKGVADGLAELDSSGIVPTSQLPSYVDSIDEYADLATLVSTDPQETNKIYVTTDDNKVFRYTGTAGSYSEISPTLVLGSTSATAYRGDRGTTAYDHSQSAHNYEPVNANIVKSVAGVLPALDGSNLTGINVGSGNQLISPDEQKDLTLSDLNLMYQDGSYARLYIDDTESRLTAPNGQSMIKVKDADFVFDDGTRDRIESDGIGTTLRSTTGAYLSLLSNSFLVSDNVRTRITSDDAGTRLYSTGINASYLSIADAAIYLNDGARPRLQIDDSDTILFSPGGTKFITLDNNGIAISGDTTISGATELIEDGETLKFTVATLGSKHYMAWYASNGTSREAWLGFGSSANYQFTIFNEKADNHIVIKTTGTGTLVLQNIPTSAAGLPTGGLWKSDGFLRIA